MKKIVLLLILLSLIGNTLSVYAQDSKNDADKQNYSLLRDQAIKYYQDGDYKSAIKNYESVGSTVLKPDDYLIIANCYDSLGNKRIASEYLIKATSINPKYALAYYNLGLLYFNSSNYELAVDNFKRAAKYDKSFASAYYDLGCSYLSLKNYKEAKNSFQKAINLDSSLTNAYYNLGLSFDALNQPKNAAKYFDTYKKLKSEDSDSKN